MLAIDTLEAIQAGGTTKWIRIRGADTSNPVLLLIQQGPGLPMINEARRIGRDKLAGHWLVIGGDLAGGGKR